MFDDLPKDNVEEDGSLRIIRQDVRDREASPKLASGGEVVPCWKWWSRHREDAIFKQTQIECRVETSLALGEPAFDNPRMQRRDPATLAPLPSANSPGDSAVQNEGGGLVTNLAWVQVAGDVLHRAGWRVTAIERRPERG